ncbi:MAG: hypothetical protein A3J38_05465 [Gammaproteobacteria bacterium RIFCSPHIGHO2_12_FULL_45_9]|nr:MAG: hypothetical protein A3J38_05465 [Gammaproteobacteria bacterium RIFCSPHIGHO2_12_FULL_45_9]
MTAKKITTLIAAAAAGFISISRADVISDYYQHQYAGFNGAAIYVNKIYQNTNPGQISKRGFLSGGGNVYIGSALSSFFGLELNFGYYSFGSYGGLTSIALNGKFTEVLAKQWMLYQKIGGGYGEIVTRFNNTRIDSDNLIPTAALGIGYQVIDPWLLNLEFDAAMVPSGCTNAVGLIGALGIGTTYYFSA